MKFKFQGKRIGGILTVIPKNVRTFEEEMGNYTASNARMKRMKEVMGYGEHRIVEPETCVSDMAVFGAEQLFARELAKKEEIGALLLVTDSPDHFLPPTSNIIQGRLGLSEDVNTDGRESGLCTLLRKISALEGTFRLRLLYIHPDHFNEDILPVIKADERILPYFDIPFQSGDDATIRAMHRTGTREKYEKLIEKIRDVFPDAAIRTTFLTGFPGETDESAKNTQDFLKKIATDWSGCFPYSREEDTPANSFENHVSGKISKKRAAQLVKIQSKITRDRLAYRNRTRVVPGAGS